MSCGHTTCTGFTAVRRSQIGQPEVSTTHRDGDKTGIFFSRLGHISTECENIDYMVDCRPRDSLSEGRGW
jgi:hypothetical protein